MKIHNLTDGCWLEIIRVRKLYDNTPGRHNFVKNVYPYQNSFYFNGLTVILEKYNLGYFRGETTLDNKVEDNTHILENIKKLSLKGKTELFNELKNIYADYEDNM